MPSVTKQSKRYRLPQIPIREISSSQLRYGFLIAILLHLIIIGLFYFDIVHDPFHQTGTWHFHQGGDQIGYFDLAQSLFNGQPIPSKFTLGYPLLLLPAIAVFHPTSADDLIPLSAILNACLLFPVAQLFFVSLAYRILRSRTIALSGLILWTLSPLIAYVLLALTGRADLGAVWGVHLAWLQMLSDPPAAFLTVLSFWLLFQICDRRGATVLWSAALGLTCGFLLLLRINTVISVSVVLLILVIVRRWQALGIVLALTFLCFIPQLTYNAAFFGNPLAFGYQVLEAQPPDGLMSFRYALQFLHDHVLLAGIGGVCLLAFFATVTYTLWGVDRVGAIALVLWGIGYLSFFSLYYYSWIGGAYRFLIPVYPAYSLLAVGLFMKRTEAKIVLRAE
ncbi:MAG: hypothetical protein ABI700_17650 [Chloroflexota bacterium]